MSHQAEWLAVARWSSSGPSTLAVAIAPTTATPSVRPTWRLVVATAAATPAWLAGMPDTAAFVIGGLTAPNPSPKTQYAAKSHPSEVSALSGTSIRLPTPSPRPPTTSGPRTPRVPTTRPAIGLTNAVMSASGSVHRPALNGERPRTSCRYSVLRNRNPPKAANATTAMTAAAENGRLAKKRGSMSGSSLRSS